MGRVEGHARTARRAEAVKAIRRGHYTRSVSSGASHVFGFEDAVVIFSVPSNPQLAGFLGFEPWQVWELSRLYVPDHHRPNLLTEAVAYAVKTLRQREPDAEVLVAYSDASAGHSGGVYRACS